MEEKRKITSGDKIPGCERLTRPEEIQGLSKYLGAIRDTQEQWISENMPDEPLEIEVKDETKLPDKKEMLEGQELYLKTSRLDLHDVKDIGLREGLVRLKNVKDPGLPKEKENLHIGKEPDLPTDKELIHPSDPQLRPGVEQLKNVTNPDLPDELIGLHVDKEVGLPKDRESLYVEDRVSLPKSKSELKNIQDPSLPESMVGLNVKEDINLPNTKERLGNIEDPDLPKDSLGLHVTEPDKLSDFIDNLFVDDPYLKQDKIDLHVTEPDRLPWEILEISPTSPNELPTDKLHIHPTDPELPDKRLDIHPTDPGLPDTLVELETKEPNELPKTMLGIDPDEIKDLPDSSLKIDVPDPKRIEEVLDSMRDNELYEELMKLLIFGKNGKEHNQEIGTGNYELAGVLSAYFGAPTISSDRAREAAEKIADILEKQKKLLEIATGPDLPTEIKNIPEKEKVVSEEKLKEIKDNYSRKPEELRARYQVPESTDPTKDPTNLLNPAVYDQDRYIRRLAELAADAGDSLVAYRDNIPGTNSTVSSTLRQYILKNTLMALFMARAKLERATKTDRSRLPGGNTVWQGVQKLVQGGLTGPRDAGSLIRGATNLALNAIGNDTYLPQNRPEGKSDILTGEFKGTSTEKLDRLNENYKLTQDNGDVVDKIKDEISGAKQFLKNLKKAGASKEDKKSIKNKINDLKSNLKAAMKPDVMNFSRDYLSSSGIELTLKDLCGVSPKNITTIEDFYTTLKNSPYITTPTKIMNRKGGNLTLDTNAYWEVVIEPYLSRRQNGGYSYLPSISEINYENKVNHGVNTAYGPWIPINNFELQKSKLVSKSLGLYDGEINYPMSIEYTNEFRITVVDDQYKSWRRYFQKCSDVSVYYSEAHGFWFYGLTPLATPTAIDKTSICIAFYKNITFRIRVYCMSPQYSTIKKFDLLCVMKDFMEEYSGDIDSGASDLTISFSIVGENPPTDAEDAAADEEDRNDRLLMESLDISAAQEKEYDEMNKEEPIEPIKTSDPIAAEETAENTPPSIDPKKAKTKSSKATSKNSGSSTETPTRHRLLRQDELDASTPRIRTQSDVIYDKAKIDEENQHAPAMLKNLAAWKELEKEAWKSTRPKI